MEENRNSVLISCEGIACSRMGRTLFGSLGVSLMKGGVLLVVGRNGSGKSSLLRALAGLLPAQGRIFRPEHFLYLGHHDAVKEEVTVEATLRFWAALGGEEMLLPAAIEYFGLAPYLEMSCARLSAGWKKRVALARLLTNPAPLWLLDEPYTHLDDEAVRLLGNLVESRARKSGAVIIAAHHLPPGALGRLEFAGVLNIEDFMPECVSDVSDAA